VNSNTNFNKMLTCDALEVMKHWLKTEWSLRFSLLEICTYLFYKSIYRI